MQERINILKSFSEDKCPVIVYSNTLFNIFIVIIFGIMSTSRIEESIPLSWAKLWLGSLFRTLTYRPSLLSSRPTASLAFSFQVVTLHCAKLYPRCSNVHCFHYSNHSAKGGLRFRSIIRYAYIVLLWVIYNQKLPIYLQLFRIITREDYYNQKICDYW